LAIERYSNDASDFLDANINNSVTSLDITDGSTFPTDGLFSIKIGSEIMKVTAVTPGTPPLITCTVVRGQEGTTAASHTAGDPVKHVMTARSIDQTFLDQISVGSYSSLPSENKAGRLYTATDGFGLFYNNGSGYLNYTPWGIQLYPPDNSQFSWVNQNSSTITQNGSGLALAVPTQASLNLSARVKSLAASSNYTATGCFWINMQQSANTSSFGLVLRESSSGKLVQYATGLATGFGRQQYVNNLNSPTSYSSTPGGIIGIESGNPIWLRIVDDGTNRRFRFSYDGVNFYEIFANGRTSFITPDQIGFYIDSVGLANTATINCISWHEA